MPDKLSVNPSDTRTFVRLSTYSVRKLQSVRGLSQYSRNRLKKLQLKIKDLKSPALRPKDRRELIFEISSEIEKSENFGMILSRKYLSYFSSLVSDYKKEFPELFVLKNPGQAMLSEFRSKFELVQKIYEKDTVQKWKVINRETAEDSVLSVHRIPEDFHPESFYASFSGWRQMEHRNILRLRNIFAFPDVYGIETEPTSETDLGGVSRPMKLGDALFMAYQIIQGLHYAHSMNVPHLALTPEDVILSQSGGIKIGGWNKSQLVKQAIAEKKTPPFLSEFFTAPELLGPETGKPTPSADMYSLAKIICYLLSDPTAPKPSDKGGGKDGMEEINSMVDGLKIPDSEMKTILRLCLVASPENRPSAQEFISVLARFLELGGDEQVDAGRSHEESSITSEAPQLSKAVAASETNRVTVGKPSEDSSTEILLRSIAKEIRKQLDRAKYDAILLTLKNREKEILAAYPNLKESIGVTKSNLSAIIRFPTVPREEVITKVKDLIAALGYDE